jgi:hypothetical protein
MTRHPWKWLLRSASEGVIGRDSILEVATSAALTAA